MALREGPERQRLLEVVRQFCAAEQSADPGDSAVLFVASLREKLERQSAEGAGAGWAYTTSADPRAKCEPGRTWYRGGSLLFAEVRLLDRSDRLTIWRGDWPLISEITYGRPRVVDGRRAKSLRQTLMNR
jgi:hypothetical protein